MGGSGSGRKRITPITDGVKKMIIVARSFGMKWDDINTSLGYHFNAKYIDDFRRQNPEFDAECEVAFFNRKLSFAQKLEKAALPNEGGVNTTLAIKFAEKYGIFEKELKTAMTAVQINSGNDGNTINVCFVDAPLPQLPASETIDGTPN
jgi:hypothetical protein